MFKTLEEAKIFELENEGLLSELSTIAKSVSGCLRTEIWLNGNAPSYISVIDEEDQEIACIPIMKLPI